MFDEFFPLEDESEEEKAVEIMEMIISGPLCE